jgi:putative transposase
VQNSSFRAPNTVAFVEPFIETVRQELLDHFIVFGERHLNHLCSVFVDYYHRLRPQQAKDNDRFLPSNRRKKKTRASPPADVLQLSEIRCERRLGGLLKHHYLKAA